MITTVIPSSLVSRAPLRHLLPGLLLLEWAGVGSALPPPARAEDAAAWHRPAEFTVTPVVVNPDPGAWSATMVEGPVNSWILGGAFEPMVLRRKWLARGDSPNEVIIARTDIDGWNSFRDGLYDGATVRVYRVVNGAFTKVRTDTVAHHYASGWYPAGQTDEHTLVAPDRTTAQVDLDPWYKRNEDYFFKVVAVDQHGRESADSAIVTLKWNAATDTRARAANTLVKFKPAAEPAGTNIPAAPANLQGSFDPETALMTLTWEAAKEADCAGYRLYYADRDPAALNGFHLYLSETPADTNAHLRTGDLVFLEKIITEWDKRIYLADRVDGTVQEGHPPTLTPFHVGETNRWALVPHPGPVPAELQELGGQTCMELELGSDQRRIIKYFNHASPSQSWYRVLQPGKTYQVELWLRQSGMTNPVVTFDFGGYYHRKLPSAEFQVTGAWQKFTATFTPTNLYEGAGIGAMELSFRGPGKLWLDNYRVYEVGTPFMDLTKEAYAHLEESGLQFMRMQSTVVSDWGITMEMLTNPAGVLGNRAWHSPKTLHTYGNLLSILKQARIKPWLQLEIYFSEEELLGWVEFMAAPYDPAVDTPASKPWAYKRYRQGQQAPWTEAFDQFIFELSNETWNGLFAPWTFLGHVCPDAATGRDYKSGEVYGLWQEYVIGVLRSSPYWTEEVNHAFAFALGGWAVGRDRKGYGQQAAACTPSSRHMTVAGYNGGWDEGEPPAEANDETRFKTLVFAVQAAGPRARLLATTRAEQKESGEADYDLGTYEAGPGYNLNGLNGVSMNAAQVEAESQVMKSLAGGTATIDSFLMRARYGYRLQNFYHFDDNRHYWTSHARWEHGGQTYPPWAALSMYNRYATGDHLLVLTRSTPSYNLPRTPRRGETADAAMTAVYATRSGDRYGVFCISRKMSGYPFAEDDGYTPMTLNLPFVLGPGGRITRYKLEGDPRLNNLDAKAVEVVRDEVPADQFASRFVLDASRGADDRGLPPAATYLYVFEGTKTLASGDEPQVTMEQAEETESPSLWLPVTYRIVFSQPIDPATLTAGDFIFKGQAKVEAAEVEPVPFSGDAVYLLRVTDVSTPGTIIPTLPAGRVSTLAGGRNKTSDHEGPVFELGVPEQGGTYVFSTVEDTRLSSYTKEAFGGRDRLRTFLPYDGDTGDRVFLKFPALPVLSDRVITQAEVRLFLHARSDGAEGIPHTLLAFHDNWDEETLDLEFNTIHSLTGDHTVAPTVLVQRPDQWYAWDCTNYVTNELAGDRVISMVFDVDPSVTNYNAHAEFRSRDYGEGAYAPQLRLSFAPALQPTQTAPGQR